MQWQENQEEECEGKEEIRQCIKLKVNIKYDRRTRVCYMR